MDFKEAFKFLDEASKAMDRRLMERYGEVRRLAVEGRKSYKEVGKKLDYISASALRGFLENNGFKPMVYSEEWFSDYRAVDTETYLIVDPIDGTSNFSRGIPFSCISLALADGPTIEDVYAGLVRNLFTKDVYFAYRGGGAYLNGSRIRVSRTLKTIDAFISLSIVKQYPPKAKTLELLRYTNYPRHFGSAALEECMVASGVLDAHVDIRGSLRIYDIAAGQLIVKEAGGKVLITQGDSGKVYIDKIYGIKIVSASTPHLMEKILDILGM